MSNQTRNNVSEKPPLKLKDWLKNCLKSFVRDSNFTHLAENALIQLFYL